jgi:2-keto-3-deoxy-L-rhamnonate aldolase RhmA
MAIPINRVKQKLAAGRPVSVVAPIASSAGLVELLGALGFDGVFLDGEHGPAGWEDMEHMACARRSGPVDGPAGPGRPPAGGGGGRRRGAPHPRRRAGGGVPTTPAAVDRHLELGARFLWVSLAALLAPAAREFVGRLERVQAGAS